MSRYQERERTTKVYFKQSNRLASLQIDSPQMRTAFLWTCWDPSDSGSHVFSETNDERENMNHHHHLHSKGQDYARGEITTSKTIYKKEAEEAETEVKEGQTDTETDRLERKMAAEKDREGETQREGSCIFTSKTLVKLQAPFSQTLKQTTHQSEPGQKRFQNIKERLGFSF